MTDDNLILKRGSATGTGSFGPDDYDALSDGAVVRPIFRAQSRRYLK